MRAHDHILVLVDREQGGKEAMESFGYKVHAMSEITELIHYLLRTSCISRKQGDIVLDYIEKNRA